MSSRYMSACPISWPHRRMTSVVILASCLGLFMAGCGIDGDVSVPQPVPVPKPFYLRQSPPEPDQTKTLLVGLPGAVAGIGSVEVRDVIAGTHAEGPTTASGTFSVLIVAAQSSELRIRYVVARGASAFIAVPRDRVTFGPRLGAVKAASAPVSSPDAQGIVRVTNLDAATGDIVIVASPDVDVLVSNVTSGAIVTARTDARGVFAVDIAAAVGDTLGVMLLGDPVSGDVTSNYLTFVVPAP
ncbi:MAG: hypothetical protein KAI47_00295 [Deltaproteobacteria bacterium]|nr:hypothetical protein [Deltaproteobacteria bacterium]